MQTGYRTGEIWDKTPRIRAQIVRRVCEALEKTYGNPRLGNPDDPVDDLVYIIISNKTSPLVAQRTYDQIKEEFVIWDELLNAPPSALKLLLRPAGLARVKSRQIFAALSQIKNDFETCSINNIIGRPDNEIRNYLISLPGVSEKVAKCVMMYTMDIEVLPVDSHVHRITSRLEWTSRKRADQCHEELENLIPAKRRYAFHVDCIMHGRIVCRPKEPNCAQCCINHHCRYFKSLGVNCH